MPSLPFKLNLKFNPAITLLKFLNIIKHLQQTIGMFG